jgi:hypothetical protein
MERQQDRLNDTRVENKRRSASIHPAIKGFIVLIILVIIWQGYVYFSDDDDDDDRSGVGTDRTDVSSTLTCLTPLFNVAGECKNIINEQNVINSSTHTVMGSQKHIPIGTVNHAGQITKATYTISNASQLMANECTNVSVQVKGSDGEYHPIFNRLMSKAPGFMNRSMIQDSDTVEFDNPISVENGAEVKLSILPGGMSCGGTVNNVDVKLFIQRLV